MPSDGAQFSERSPRHRRNQKPQGSNVWRQILQKRGKQKTLRNEHNSGKKRDNFELRMKIVPCEPRPKHSEVAEPLPRPQLVIHPWRIYPSYGHWDDHFDDGYIRHMALNGLNAKEKITPTQLTRFYARPANMINGPIVHIQAVSRSGSSTMQLQCLLSQWRHLVLLFQLPPLFCFGKTKHRLSWRHRISLWAWECWSSTLQALSACRFCLWNHLNSSAQLSFCQSFHGLFCVRVVSWSKSIGCECCFAR